MYSTPQTLRVCTFRDMTASWLPLWHSSQSVIPPQVLAPVSQSYIRALKILKPALFQLFQTLHCIFFRFVYRSYCNIVSSGCFNIRSNNWHIQQQKLNENLIIEAVIVSTMLNVKFWPIKYNNQAHLKGSKHFI